MNKNKQNKDKSSASNPVIAIGEPPMPAPHMSSKTDSQIDKNATPKS